MAIQDEVNTLKLQVAHFITRVQIEALIAALGTDHTTLTAAVNANAAEIAILMAEVQTLKDTAADHETRIIALEP